MSRSTGKSPDKREDLVHVLADLYQATEEKPAEERAVKKAVSLTNQLFFDAVVARYGSWESFMEIQRRRKVDGGGA